MDLETARLVLNRQFERDVSGLTPEEAAREERFEKLGERILDLHDSGRQGLETHEELVNPERLDSRFHTYRIFVSAIFVSDTHRDSDMILSLEAKRTPSMPWATIKTAWHEIGSSGAVSEKLRIGGLHDFPEDVELVLHRLEQSVNELETAAPESLAPNPEDYFTG